MGEAPPWLRTALTQTFARVPLRPYGVRQLIELISFGHGSPVPSSQGVVTQVVNILSLPPPPPLTQDVWFEKLASQLWGLLDGDAGPEMSEAAGQIIASILARRSLGAPGTAGWQCFAEPMLQPFNPVIEQTPGRSKPSKSSTPAMDPKLVLEATLLQALKRLALLTSSHPHPGLAKRLISPIVLPLWGLLSYANQFPLSGPEWAKLSRSILLRYFQIAETPKFLDLVASNLLWNGEAGWTYGPGSQGGVEIRRRSKEHALGNVETIFIRLQTLNGRVESFTSLLSKGKVADDIVITIFLNATKRWLECARGSKTNTATSLTDELEEDPLETLTNAKLSEAMSSELKANFAAHPKHVLELARTLLEDFVENKKSKRRHEVKIKHSVRAGLGHIVKTEVSDTGSSPSNSTDAFSATDTDPEEDIAAFSISLIYTILNDSNFKRTSETDALLAEIAPVLDFIASEEWKGYIVATTQNAAKTLLTVLPSSQNLSPSSKPIDPDVAARSTLQTALAELQSPEPPIRTHALSAIRSLASSPKNSHIIDIPSTTHLIISSTLSDPDSYVHTAAIPTLVSLAALAPALVTGILAEAFIDDGETLLKSTSKKQDAETNIIASLELRLRLGETLHSILSSPAVWDLSHQTDPTGTHRALHSIIAATVTLSSRRGLHRPATLSARNSAAAAQIRLREEGEEAWGGAMPSLNAEEEVESSFQRQERETLERVVKGWEDTGLEEDVRIRASALSILGEAMEERFEGVWQVELDRAVEIALGCVVFERGVEKAILRRAAVLVVLGALKGLDRRLEGSGGGDGGVGAGVGLSTGKWEEVERVLKWVKSEDSDEITRGHAGVVLEGLETWRMKSWFGLRAEGADIDMRLSTGLEGGMRGLVVGLDEGKKGKRIIEEVE